MELIQSPPDAAMPFLMAADLQDNLLMVSNDLDRLQTLLSGACDTMLSGFCNATSDLNALPPDAAVASVDVRRAIGHLSEAVIALQFQDMATQLIAHTQQRLRYCTDRLAIEALVDDEDDTADSFVAAPPTRPNPVTQDEMDAGSVDLF